MAKRNGEKNFRPAISLGRAGDESGTSGALPDAPCHHFKNTGPGRCVSSKVPLKEICRAPVQLDLYLFFELACLVWGLKAPRIHESRRVITARVSALPMRWVMLLLEPSRCQGPQSAAGRFRRRSASPITSKPRLRGSPPSDRHERSRMSPRRPRGVADELGSETTFHQITERNRSGRGRFGGGKLRSQTEGSHSPLSGPEFGSFNAQAQTIPLTAPRPRGRRRCRHASFTTLRRFAVNPNSREDIRMAATEPKG